MAGQHVICDPSAGWEVRSVTETGSTNADLLAAADAGTAGHLTALRADHQTAGRGRLDRRWSAPAGSNLLVSLLFVDVPPDPTALTHLVGLAAVDAIERLASAPDGPAGGSGGHHLGPKRIGLKWPNDVLLDGRKLAGVLAQRSASTGAVVVGLGLNVGWAPPDAASLAGDLGWDVDPADLLMNILSELPPERVGSPSMGDLRSEYRRRLLTLGEPVRVELPGGRSVSGVAVDVDDRGRLIVDDGGSHHVLDVGDVVHLRHA